MKLDLHVPQASYHKGLAVWGSAVICKASAPAGFTQGSRICFLAAQQLQLSVFFSMSAGCSLLSPKDRHSAKHGYFQHKSASTHEQDWVKANLTMWLPPSSKGEPLHRWFRRLWLMALGLALLSLFHPNWKATEDWYWSVHFNCHKWSSWRTKAWIWTVQSSSGEGNYPFSPCLHHGIGKIPLLWALGSSELLICGPK